MKTTDTVFDDLTFILNPRLNYDGEITFPEAAILGSQKGEELSKLLRKKYYGPLCALFKDPDFATEYPLCFENLPTEKGRETIICPLLFLGNIAAVILGLMVPEDKQETDDIIAWFRETARDYRMSISKYLKGESKELPEHVVNLYEEMKSTGANFTINEFLQGYSDQLTIYLMGFRYIKDIISKPLTVEELSACVNPDKCSLSLAKLALENAKLPEEETGMLHNSISVAVNFKMAMLEVRKHHPEYRLSTTTCDLSGKPIRHYNLDDFIREMDEVMGRHPEYKTISMEVPDDEDYRDFDNAMGLIQKVLDREAIKELSGSWEFLPKGEKIVRVDAKTGDPLKSTSRMDSSYVSSLPDESDQELLFKADARQRYLESTNYLFNLKGKNNFEGYVGYLYENGIVIFEKLYESIDPLIPARSNATYVMSVNNFVHMSRKTKGEIMDYIKSGGSEVRRVYHSRKEGRWEEKVGEIVDGRGYSDATLSIIDTLLKSGELSQDEGLSEGTGGRK